MFKRFLAWFRPPGIPTPSTGSEDDRIVVPFRVAEYARVSLHAIADSPQVPAEVRSWITEWLHSYNTELAILMRRCYGDEILPVLDRITTEVMPSDPQRESWELWEQEFKEEL